MATGTVSATVVPRSLCESEDGEGPVHGACGPSGGFGDVGAPGHAECADGEVSQRGHGPWPGAGPDLGLVFLVEGVADPVQGLDGPLLADVAGQGGGACLFRFRAGDAERGDGRDRLAVQVGDVPLDQEDLADVRERQPFGGGQDLDGAGGDAPVALVGGGVRDRDVSSRAGRRSRRTGRAGSPSPGSTNSPPPSWMRRAVALTVCSASAVTTLPCRSSWPRTTAATGTSFVFAPTPACAATTEDAASGPTRAASSRTWVPSGFLAPLTALPSSLTCTNAGGQSSSAGSARPGRRARRGSSATSRPPRRAPRSRRRSAPARSWSSTAAGPARHRSAGTGRPGPAAARPRPTRRSPYTPSSRPRPPPPPAPAPPRQDGPGPAPSGRPAPLPAVRAGHGPSSGTGRETMGAAGAGTATGMADLPTTRLRWLGSVRGPLFLPGPRRTPRLNTPLMTRSQRPATNRDPTRQTILERPCGVGYRRSPGNLAPLITRS